MNLWTLMALTSMEVASTPTTMTLPHNRSSSHANTLSDAPVRIHPGALVSLKWTKTKMRRRNRLNA